MTEWIFKRIVSKAMLNAINEGYNSEAWIKQYMDDPEVFLAVRDGSLNFYYQGNSILQLLYKNNCLDGNIHYKYLLNPTYKPEYFSVNNMTSLPAISPRDSGAVDLLKKSCKSYGGSEKEQLQKLIKSNSNIVDVEISFSKGDGTKGQNRIDFCALRDEGNGLELCFFEAKDYSNKEIRNGKVIEQVHRYEQTLTEHKDEIKEAYEECFRVLLALSCAHPAMDLMKQALDQGFSISSNVRLVVFGFDAPQKEKLKSFVQPLKDAGLQSILQKGDAKDFCVGISK